MNREVFIQNRGTNSAEAPQPRRSSKPWRILHTTEAVSEIAALIEGQLAVGMRPSIVTPDGYVISADAFRASAPTEESQISLLNAWNDVRHWRKVILEADPQSECDLVHAHSFAPGMAGVRNCPITVYEIQSFIENHAANRPAENGSWLSRSFRVAEQFVISRAAAVVVRSESMRQAVIRRGASAENVFAIPAPMEIADTVAPALDEDWLHSLDVDRYHRILIHAPHWKLEVGPDGELTESSRGLLEAFAIASTEEDGAYLLVESDAAAHRIALDYCDSLEINNRVRVITAVDRQRAFDAADIIVSDGPDAATISRNALHTQKALLASDSAANRDVTPSGRGCLWFRSGDFKDIAHRLSFMARNRDFRFSLAESGRHFIVENCDPLYVAMEYDRVYRHAIARRKSGGLQTPAIRLTPASVML